jgi:hypothetical protein
MTVNHAVRQTECHAQFAHFVFEQFAQWFQQFQV